MNYVTNQALIDAALEQIIIDVENKNLTAIEELLSKISDEYLIGFLSN